MLRKNKRQWCAGNSMAIKLVSFDLDGTLTDLWGFDKVFWNQEVPKLIAERHNITVEEAEKRLLADAALLGGEDSIEYYYPDHWFKHFDLKEDWQRVMRDMKKLVVVFDDVHHALGKLKEDFPLIVFSNSPREFIDMKMEVENLGGLFTETISAVSDYRMVKRDPEIYHKIMERFNVKADEVVHVGDHFNFDFEAAKQAGMHAFWLNHDNTVTGEHVVHSMTEFANKVFELAGMDKRVKNHSEKDAQSDEVTQANDS